MDMPICPLCGLPVNVNTEAHITEQDGTVKHHQCPQAAEGDPDAAATV